MTNKTSMSKVVVTYLRGTGKIGKTRKRATSIAKGTVQKTQAIPLNRSQCDVHGRRHANDERKDGHDHECHKGTSIYQLG